MFANLPAWLRKHWRRPAAARRVSPCIDVLEDRCVPATIAYHGGPLLTHVEVQGVYYGPRWSRAAFAGQVGYLDGFLNTIVQSSFMDTLTNAGYGVGRGSASPGKLLSGGLGRRHAVTDRQIRQTLQGAIGAGRLQAPDANRLYVVFVQPGTVLQPIKGGGWTVFVQDGGVYQSSFRARVGGGHRATIPYVVVAYPGANGNLPGLSTLDTLTTRASAALADAVMDPGATPLTLGSGWNAGGLNGEVADLPGDWSVRLDGYAVQRVFNQDEAILTPAGATAAPQVAFGLPGNGDLVEQTASGSQKVLGNVTVVSSQGIDANGRAMVDAVLTDGEAFEVHDGGPALSLGAGVQEARAGQVFSFVLFQDGTLKEFAPGGLSFALSDPGALNHLPRVTSFTLGLDLSGANVVDAVFADGTTRAITPTYG
jgi:hypothetical protein